MLLLLPLFKQESKVPTVKISRSESHSSQVLKPRVKPGLCSPHSIRVTPHRVGSQPGQTEQSRSSSQHLRVRTVTHSDRRIPKQWVESCRRPSKGPSGTLVRTSLGLGTSQELEAGSVLPNPEVKSFALLIIWPTFHCKPRHRCLGGSSPIHTFITGSRERRRTARGSASFSLCCNEQETHFA